MIETDPVIVCVAGKLETETGPEIPTVPVTTDVPVSDVCTVPVITEMTVGVPTIDVCTVPVMTEVTVPTTVCVPVGIARTVPVTVCIPEKETGSEPVVVMVT
jgi:hypothetical protein